MRKRRVYASSMSKAQCSRLFCDYLGLASISIPAQYLEKAWIGSGRKSLCEPIWKETKTCCQKELLSYFSIALRLHLKSYPPSSRRFYRKPWASFQPVLHPSHHSLTNRFAKSVLFKTRQSIPQKTRLRFVYIPEPGSLLILLMLRLPTRPAQAIHHMGDSLHLALVCTRSHVPIDFEHQRPVAARVPRLGDLPDGMAAAVDDVDAPTSLGVWDGDLVAADFDAGRQGRGLVSFSRFQSRPLCAGL